MSKSPLHYSHIGILTVDLDRSIAFYRDALGFTPTRYSATEGTTEISALCGIDGPIESRRQFMARADGLILELRHWTAPATSGSTEARPMNEYGVSHISFHVDDVDEVAALITEFGGSVLQETRTKIGEMDLLFCTDPNGVRIELMAGIQHLLRAVRVPQ